MFLLLCIYVNYIIIKLRSISRLCLFVVRSPLLDAVFCVPVHLYYFLIFLFLSFNFMSIFEVKGDFGAVRDVG